MFGFLENRCRLSCQFGENTLFYGLLKFGWSLPDDAYENNIDIRRWEIPCECGKGLIQHEKDDTLRFSDKSEYVACIH